MPLLFAYLLILIGGLFLAAELVLFTHGVLAMIGLSGLIVGTVFVYGNDPVLGLVTLAGLFLAVPILGRMLLLYWPQSPIGRRMILEAPIDTNVMHTAAMQELELLRGRYGKTLSTLRPAGTTDFDGRRVDTLSDGTMIEAGRWVRCIEVREGKVIVREMQDPPSAADLDHMELE